MFTTGQVSKIVGIPKRTLQYWAETDFLVPSLEETTGTGHHRKYSFRDLVELKAISELRDNGVSLQKLRQVADFLKDMEELEAPFAEAFLVCTGENPEDIYFVTEEKEVVSVLKKPGQHCFKWVLDLSSTVDKLEKEVKKVEVAR